MSKISGKCNICNSESLPLAKGLILGKYDIQYYSCHRCGFIQTESPFWLEEAYLSPIAGSDIGLIGRNMKLAGFCSSLIPICFNPASSFLDYGGGNGMFVRMMRDRGFEFYWHDKYALNQFAKGFEISPEMKYSLITAFEVFEHFPRPLDAIEEMFRYSDTLVFSTRLLPSWNVTPDAWWYFSVDTGQHISLYSKESLELIAKEFNVNLSSNGSSLHVFSSKIIPSMLLKALSFPPFASLLSALLNVKRQSLLEQDYYRLTGKPLTWR
jgi:hypothetical protein